MYEILQMALHYSFILTVPILIIAVILIFKLVSALFRLLTLLICFSMIVLSWSFFIEPNLLIVKDISIPFSLDKKIIVVSDTHLGLSKNSNFLVKIANEINKQSNIDMVLWAGDFVENIKSEDLEKTLKPISLINAKQYAVFGNHDFGYNTSFKKKSLNEPTEYSQRLENILEGYGVEVIDNETLNFGNFNLVGISSKSTNYQKVTTPKDTKNIILTHEPSNSLLTSENENQITFAGHTHCGQFKIPFISQALYSYDKDLKEDKYFEGLYNTEKNGKVFVSCGVGETILPIRFLNQPTIYKINLN
jgi:uncharacterized protein